MSLLPLQRFYLWGGGLSRRPTQPLKFPHLVGDAADASHRPAFLGQGGVGAAQGKTAPTWGEKLKALWCRVWVGVTYCDTYHRPFIPSIPNDSEKGKRVAELAVAVENHHAARAVLGEGEPS